MRLDFLSSHSVPGPRQEVIRYEQDGPSGLLSDEEAQLFLRDGYFIVQQAAPTDVVDQTRRYLDEVYFELQAVSKRSDDWRCHFELDFDRLSDGSVEHGKLLELLFRSPSIMARARDLLGPAIRGIFYTQIALRTPLAKVKSEEHAESLNTGRTDYHIDGQANDAGTRFPDHWTLQIGIALSDQTVHNAGNFTVFPRAHLNDWTNYPSMKKDNCLPDVGPAKQLLLRSGDAVFAHVLLPHRGVCFLTNYLSLTVLPRIY